MEILKFIIKTYGPVVASVVLMVYLCFFTKKEVNGNEKQLKDDLATVLRENAELKVQLKENTKFAREQIEKANKKIDELEEQIDSIIERSEENESNNDRT